MYKEIGISSNNVPITLSIWYTERSSPTIVFLPGTMSHPLMYENFLCGLSERGFNIIGVHYLSHGKSPKIKKNYIMEDMLHNVYDATTYGIENFGENIAVMGSSQGGILAAMAAGRVRPYADYIKRNYELNKISRMVAPFYGADTVGLSCRWKIAA